MQGGDVVHLWTYSDGMALQGGLPYDEAREESEQLEGGHKVGLTDRDTQEVCHCAVNGCSPISKGRAVGSEENSAHSGS